MPSEDFTHFGHGAKVRPERLKVKDHVAGAAAPFDWSKIKEDPIGNVSGCFGITDQDQNGSSTCTVQTTRYGFKKAVKLDISIEDIYPHIVLPGGGAYLNAPLDYARTNGVALQAQYPDPNPQTESKMTKIITIPDKDRIRTFLLTYKIYNGTNNIDTAARAAMESDYIHLGVHGSWTADAWGNDRVDPKYPRLGEWNHAIMACKESVVLRKGVPAIKARSSWCRPGGAFVHYINQNYFANNGVFEIIGVSLKEINTMNGYKVVGDATTYVEVSGRMIAVADWPAFQLLGGTTASVVELTAEQFAKFTKVDGVLFKSK